MIKYHLDEHIDNVVATGLRKRSYNVTRSNDAELRGSTDVEQLAFCLEHGRVIVTKDDDFLVLNAQGTLNAGIAFWSSRRMVGLLIRKLDELGQRRTADEMVGQVEFV